MNYDTWKATNPQDYELGPEPEEEWDERDEMPADWPTMDDDPQSMTGEADE